MYSKVIYQVSTCHHPSLRITQSPSMDAQLLAEFKTLTRSLLDSKERQQLQRIINAYKDDEDFVTLVKGLRTIISTKEQCQLLPFVRLFLLRKHRHLQHKFCEEEFVSDENGPNQLNTGNAFERPNYSRPEALSTASLNSNKKNLLSALVVRNMNESLGIGIRGGIDFGCGIFISDVQPDSAAARAGLCLGDQILFVNNVSFESITANAAARFLASAFPPPSGNNVSRLRVIFSRTGMIPAHRANRERVAWYDVRTGATVFGPYAVNDESVVQHKPPSKYSEAADLLAESVVQIHVTLSFAIRGGLDFGLGIYISALGNKDIDPELLKKFDLRVGDEIVAVNGKEIRSLRHSQAVDLLRHQRHLALTVKHTSKYPLYKEIASEVTWTSANVDESGNVPTTSTQSVRTELPWETVVTIRRNPKQNQSANPVSTAGSHEYAVARPNQSQRSLSFSLTKSSSGSLIIDAANVQQQTRLQPGGSLRSSFASATVHCAATEQPSRENMFHSSRRRNMPQRTPISTIHFDEVNDTATYCDSASFARIVPGKNGIPPRKPSSATNQTSFDSVNARIARNYEYASPGRESRPQSGGVPSQPKNASNLRSSFRNYCESKPSETSSGHRVVFSDDEKSVHETVDCAYESNVKVVNPPKNVGNWQFSNGGGVRPPSVAVKGKHTTLVKLPKRPDTSLGLGVSGGGDSPDQCLRIDHALPESIAGLAVADGLLQPGCLLLAVDGQSLVGVTHEEAVSLIRRCFRDASKPTLNLLISAN